MTEHLTFRGRHDTATPSQEAIVPDRGGAAPRDRAVRLQMSRAESGMLRCTGVAV